jgi:RimJ/RimL family protein N-acetyltransferase
VTPTVRLRPVVAEDIPTFFDHQNEAGAARMAKVEPRDRDAFESHWRRILGDEAAIVRTIEIDGRIAGNVVSWEHDGERDVGYWVGREHWGRGVATSALAAFLEELTMRPLHAHVAVDNVGSIRVLEKCGFERVGEGPTVAEDGVEELWMRLDRRA